MPCNTSFLLVAYIKSCFVACRVRGRKQKPGEKDVSAAGISLEVSADSTTLRACLRRSVLPSAEHAAAYHGLYRVLAG